MQPSEQQANRETNVSNSDENDAEAEPDMRDRYYSKSQTIRASTEHGLTRGGDSNAA